ncbi:MAG: CheR family methyltransferase [Solirubrobacteraceae bacterium]
MTPALTEVAALVLRESGMVIRASQLPALEAAIRRVEPGMTADRLLEQLTRPGLQESLIERLIDEVTIKETYFLRHREELEAIDWRALAAHAQSAGRMSVRVWSAACASGEEPYTLAMLALDAFAPGHPPVEILATDIATSSITRAQAGRYGWRSVRHVDEAMRGRWFELRPDGLTVGPTPRKLVRFARHNLLSDPIPPAGQAPFDLVVCRNVLIYFEPDAVKTTIAALRRALVPGGTLILGAADRLTGGPVAPEHREARLVREPRRPPVRPRRERPVRIPTPAPPAPDPPEPDAVFERGLAALAENDPATAVELLRRALYLDPSHAGAAFQLGRAHEAAGDGAAARRAYWQALGLLSEAGDEVHGVARRDLESAARARLEALGGG